MKAILFLSLLVIAMLVAPSPWEALGAWVLVMVAVFVSWLHLKAGEN